MKPSSAQVLALLTAAGESGVTALDCLRMAGCFRAAARVADLRADGYPVTTEYETSPDGKRYARYRLPRPVAAKPMRGTQEAMRL